MNCSIRRCLLGAGAVALLLLASGAQAADPRSLRIAVAANFRSTAEALAQRFAAEGHATPEVVSASTGQLYAQIAQGAPFDVLLSADTATPERLVREGKAEAGTLFVYAIGRLALWVPGTAAQDGLALLRTAPTDASLQHLAIANPALAPYGAAAKATLESLALWQPLQAKLVTAENIGQAHLMVASGAAQAGFVAGSDVLTAPGLVWIVPPALYPPLRQAAVRLATDAGHAADADAFLALLKRAETAAFLGTRGYAVP